MNDFLHAFPGQEPNEPVFVFIRPYWVAFLPTLFAFVFLTAMAILVQFIAASGSLPIVPPEAIRPIILTLGIFELVGLTVFLITFFDFYYDIAIVTDRELVDIDQEQLFFRRISRLNLEDVEDVTSVTSGFMQSTFNFGSIEIQTAGEARNFIIDNIRQPAAVEAIISDLASQAKTQIPESQRVPEGSAKAIIEGAIITSPKDLASLGAMSIDDPRSIQ